MTIKDIARESGYAVGTVSRVLNDHPDVSREAREKILAVIEANHFTPNSNAKHLKQQISSGIAIIVKGTRNMLFAGVLELLQTELFSRGYRFFVTYIDEADNEIRQAKLLCRERKPLGILFLGSNLKYFREGFASITVPCVLVTNSAAPLSFPNLSSVATDDEEAAAYCIRYLSRNGHRRIGVLGGLSQESDASRARLLGCERGFVECDLPFDRKTQYVPARYSMESGYQAMRKLIKLLPDMTAVFAFSDVMAIGALRALRDLHRRVPEDISLVGFDGIEMAQYSTPRLTTVKQRDEELARRGAELLLSQVEGTVSPVYETVDFALINGESVRNLTEERSL